MACNTNCRPKNYDKEPEKNAYQQERMRDVFDQAASGSEKNGYCSRADEKRRFSAHCVAPTLCATTQFLLFRHGREHIEFALVRQSADDGDLLSRNYVVRFSAPSLPLTTSNCPDDHKWFGSLCDRIREWSSGRFMR